MDFIFFSGHVSRECPQSSNGWNSFGATPASASAVVAAAASTTAAPAAAEEETPVINWKELYKMAEENRMAKWKDEPPIVKEFYQEHPDVAS